MENLDIMCVVEGYFVLIFYCCVRMIEESLMSSPILGPLQVRVAPDGQPSHSVRVHEVEGYETRKRHHRPRWQTVDADAAGTGLYLYSTPR